MRRIQSYSSIRTFKQCPQRYKRKYIDGQEDIPGEAALYGRETHEKVYKKERGKNKKQRRELSYAWKIQGRKAPTPYMCHDVAKNIYVEGELGLVEMYEEKLALTVARELTDFDDPGAVFRGIIDYARVHVGTEALAKSLQKGELFLSDLVETVVIYDWKTGAYKSDRKQLSLYALFFFGMFEGLQEVSCQNVYLTEERTSPMWTIKRDKADRVWSDLLLDIRRIEEEKAWHCNRSPLCDYCSFKEDCEAHGTTVTDDMIVRGAGSIEFLRDL